MLSATRAVTKLCSGPTSNPHPSNYIDSNFSLIREYEDWYLNSLCLNSQEGRKCHCRNSILPAAPSTEWPGYQADTAAGSRQVERVGRESPLPQSRTLGAQGVKGRCVPQAGAGEMGKSRSYGHRCDLLILSLPSLFPAILTQISVSSTSESSLSLGERETNKEDIRIVCDTSVFFKRQ